MKVSASQFEIATKNQFRSVSRWIDTSLKPSQRVIIGIAKGGLIPSVYFAHALDARLESIKCSSYSSEHNRGEIKVSDWAFDIDPEIREAIIVDDIIESAQTANAVTKIIRKVYPNVQKIFFSAIYTNSNFNEKTCLDSKVFGNESTVYVKSSSACTTSEWLYFPWEIS